MLKELRKRDYIIFFVITMLGLLVNLTSGTGSSLVWPVVKILIASLVVSAVMGTLTNVIFRKRKKLGS
ncbi:hypothetical protein [Paenibacillus xylanilyticus]|uniref:hypothetical protein n=1 Tax=Paenibacillus xylanilyticus TaxID=248903 RepID=UPI0039A2786A